ncbi:hypothetical protein CDAR_241871 [Caerostris darwini]|uniref:Uncharacterized protein n=1 Tax=Caerostris darwini TaxID=1538125 RepID=A0AAV4NQB5_9ARAC|nr:hypothetical protein CDAR_241871 [Caerostris darwini]
MKLKFIFRVVSYCRQAVSRISQLKTQLPLRSAYFEKEYVPLSIPNSNKKCVRKLRILKKERKTHSDNLGIGFRGRKKSFGYFLGFGNREASRDWHAQPFIFWGNGLASFRLLGFVSTRSAYPFVRGL